MGTRDTLLLACGTSASRAALRAIFEADFNLLEADTSQQTKLLLEQNHHCIAVMILDITVPQKVDRTAFNSLSSFSVLQEIPIVIIAEDEASAQLAIFEMGATDVYSPHTDPYILQHRIHNIVELYQHKWHLQEQVAAQAAILQHSNDAMVDALSSIIEYRSLESGQHILRIRRFTQFLLEELAHTCPEYELTEEKIRIISSASALHDIGKISIPDAILNKPGRLTIDECNIMKTHSAVGCQIVEKLTDIGNEEYLRYAHNICHYHHERWDGGGYPEGLSGDDIPICAQVVGLADAYDALTSDRVYKKAVPFEKAINMIVNGECGIFSPKLLECFKHVSSKFEALTRAYSDGLSPNSENFDTTLPPPVPKDNPGSLQAVQEKYQALLHHTNAAVIEVDLDLGLYHLVHNPDPNLALLRPGTSFQETQKIIAEELLLPEERERFQQMLYEDIPRFFRDGLRRQTLFFRLRPRVPGAASLYSVTLLRQTLHDLSRRQMLIIWEPAEKEAEFHPSVQPSSLSKKQAHYQLITMIRCRNDALLTIEDDENVLFSLLGYSSKELSENYHNSLIDLALPQDRQVIRKKFNEQLSIGNEVELTYQVRHKNGHPLWILHKATLVRELDGHEYLYGILADVTRAKSAQTTNTLSLEQYQLILAQTGHIIFDWDLKADVILFSRTWQDIFGYTPFRENAYQSFSTISHLHPDDVPRFLTWVNAFKEHLAPAAIEIRIANSSARYLWCRFRGTAEFDSDGTASRLTGTIVNIDDDKRTTAALQHQANQDSLTKLLNKQAGRKQTEEYLTSAAPGSRSAMLIIDLDNFKQLNDRFGHMFGDAVLVQVAQELKKLFRAQDIISRFGGDEFMVLLRDIPDQTLVERRCHQLLDIFDQVFSGPLYQCPLGCSIGAAFSPEHGTTYQDLFLCADQALYHSKKQGKNQFTLYGKATAPISSAKDLPIVHTRIDSDEQPGLSSENIVQFAFRHLYSAKHIESAVNEIIALMGEQTNVSRVYVFENTPDNKFCNNTYEWCNAGISPEKDSLQNISYETDIPNYEDNFDERGIFYCPDVSELPQHLRDILEPQGIKSLLHCAIRDNGVFRGYIGFDDCTSKRLWTKDQIQILTFFSEMLGVFLLKEQAQEELVCRAKDLNSILDSQKDWIYVIDPDTCELKFLNASVKATAPYAQEGMLCYEAFRGQKERCSGCPAKDIRRDKVCAHTFFNEKMKIHEYAEASLIQWGGKEACLLACRENPSPL